jgi:spermidine/putrescine transport system permease protein
MGMEQQSKGRMLQYYAWVAIVIIYLPVLLLPLFSFNDGRYIAFPIRGLTLKWYIEMFNTPAMHKALWNSIQVAVVTSVLATAIGIFGAKAVTRYRMPGKGPVMFIVMLPLVIPTIVFGTSLLIFVRWIGLDLSLFSIIIGHMIICIPFSIAVLISRFEGFDRALEDAAADLGVGAAGTFFRVTMPLVWPGVIASVLLCFVISFDEFIMAFFLSGSEPTLPVYMYSRMRFPQKLPGVLAMGSLVIMASVVILILAEFFRRRGQDRGIVASGTGLGI